MLSVHLCCLRISSANFFVFSHHPLLARREVIDLSPITTTNNNTIFVISLPDLPHDILTMIGFLYPPNTILFSLPIVSKRLHSIFDSDSFFEKLFRFSFSFLEKFQTNLSSLWKFIYLFGQKKMDNAITKIDLLPNLHFGTVFC